MPVLRLYTWSPRSVSLGRFQKHETSVNDEACRKRGIDIVRRITGGRAVLHDRELTYCIVARTDDPFFPNDVLGTYKVIGRGLLAALQDLGLNVEMVSRSGRFAGMVRSGDRESACFSSPSWYEILANNRKIAGSAQRRLPAAFLQHGSILIDYDPRLEAEVIPGSGSVHAVTSIQQELGRSVTIDEVKAAVLSGFARALGITFIT